MNIIEQIQQKFITFLTATFSVPQSDLNQGLLTLNTDEHKQNFGDLNSNAAMVLAKQLGKPPREIAQTIIANFTHPALEKIEIAGPGFLNFFLTSSAFATLVQELHDQKANFFKLSPTTKKHNFSVEYVSANPTGPLHLGHGRGGIIGDVLSNILQFIGHTVTREFYINDAGAQIHKLGNSLKIRCQQALGQEATLPEDAYQGAYLIDLAKQCIAENGNQVIEQPISFFSDYGKKHLLAQQKETLKNYGIEFDVWFSEKTLHLDGSIEKAITLLKEMGFVYEQEGALWFKSTEFGDDKDRVVRKANGELTYVAADIAYMKNKIDRGADRLVMALGHDHHGYVSRLQALLTALNLGATLEVILYQLVKMKASGQLVRMSKRAGNIVMLEDVIETVGKDVSRFFYLNRKADAQLEFDLDLALKKTEENPVFYIQYAYVRTSSILAKAQETESLCNVSLEDSKALGMTEYLLIKKIASLKALLESISTHYQTHQLTYYALELAQTFHAYYGKNRVIDIDNIQQSRGRLFLVSLVRNTLDTVLTLLEVSRPEKM